MVKHKVIIRADGSAKVGFGHIYRTLALAQMIKDEFDCVYISHEAPDFLIRELKRLNIPFVKVNNINYNTPDEREKGAEVPFDMGQLLQGDEIVVTDGYWFGPNYQKAIKQKGCKLVSIDDVHQEEFFSDLIINHAPGVSETDYKAQKYTQFALGFRYALLRPVFLEQAKKERHIEKIETIFICFGGSDLKNYTQRVLSVVSKYKAFKKIIIVSGNAYPHYESLESYINNDDRIQYLSSANDNELIKLMLEADLAIVPASGILMEILAVGTNVISGMAAENQKKIFEDYKKINAFISAELFGYDDIDKAIKAALLNTNKFVRFFDGQSAKRISQEISNLLLNIRPVEQKDGMLLFNWANDVEVRKNAIQKNQIKFDDHLSWFNSRLNSPSVRIFILENQGIPVGQIRYENNFGFWVIDYSIDEKYRGKGWGKYILRMTLKYFVGEKIKAYVANNNLRSAAVFELVKFVNTTNEIINGELFNVYELDV